jgi:hypothetical protein
MKGVVLMRERLAFRSSCGLLQDPRPLQRSQLPLDDCGAKRVPMPRLGVAAASQLMRRAAMSSSFADSVARMLDELTPAEREGAVAYLVAEPIEKEARLALPGVEIVTRARSLLAFVDQDPAANWGHPARYILVACDDRAPAISIPARLPPFGQKGGLPWRVAYRAPAVPHWAVAVPET